MLYEAKQFALKDGREAVLRVPEPDDAGQLLDYLRDTAAETDFVLRYPDEVHYTLEQERRLLEGLKGDPGHLMLCCFVDGRLAGNCSMQINDKRKVRHRASLAIALYRAYWGLGIGTAMFNALLDVARKKGVEQVELEYVEGNERGRALYEKMGFVQYGVHPDAIRLADGTSRSEIMMLKRL